MPADDDRLTRDVAVEAGYRLLTLHAGGMDADDLRKAGDASSHEFLSAQLTAQRPGDAILSEECKDDKARLTADRVWIVDPLDGTREFGEPGRTDWAVHVALWNAANLASAQWHCPPETGSLAQPNHCCGGTQLSRDGKLALPLARYGL